jgi:hypothetical protein
MDMKIATINHKSAVSGYVCLLDHEKMKRKRGTVYADQRVHTDAAAGIALAPAKTLYSIEAQPYSLSSQTEEGSLIIFLFSAYGRGPIYTSLTLYMRDFFLLVLRFLTGNFLGRRIHCE